MRRGARRPRSSLLGSAWDVLQAGPLPAASLAKQVLRLDGNAAAAAAAVSALLGDDDRFEIGRDGAWRLRPDPGPPPGTPLIGLRYAVVDVETTGGRYRNGHRMTEIAIVDVRNGVVADQFRTLLNPGRRVPFAAERLTGITSEMAAAAPFFDEVAEEVRDRIEGRVFVAHGAAFDWGWVRAHLVDAVGDVPRVERLCTVRLARRLLPDLRSRNLDALADYFRIPVHDRHRAHGDALATARVLLRLLDHAAALGIGDLHSLERYKATASQADLLATYRT